MRAGGGLDLDEVVLVILKPLAPEVPGIDIVGILKDPPIAFPRVGTAAFVGSGIV